MVNGDHIYVLGFDHGESYFQHAILVLEDLKSDNPYDNQTEGELFSNFYIYIGDSIDYT